MTNLSAGLLVGEEVADALDRGRPVVALESTIVTHGMPYPQNLETAREVEAIVRENGAVPATIAVLEGAVRVGLSERDLEKLAALAASGNVLKLSRADLAFAAATGTTGSTTVAATMLVAQLAGIKVFATGGIGGVHRGAETSFDVSADLEELARTTVIVVCAGPKAILEIPKTLEVLETKGVPVVVHGADDLPAFWSRSSGIKAPLRLDTADAVAAFQRARERLSIGGGLLVAHPIAADDEIPRATVEAWIGEAIREADEKGIAGKALTPFLLGAMFALSGGRSLDANRALVKANACLAAQIAVAMVSQA